MNKRLVLLDSHAILHRAYHALPDFASTKGEPTGALYGLCLMLLKIIEELKPDYIVGTFDLPQPTYRHEAYKEYKAGRKKSDPELISQLKRARDVYTAFGIPWYEAPGFEADDMLGTIVEQVERKLPELDVVIASGDMDTLQLVVDDKVRVYTLKKGIKDTIIYNEKAVLERFGFLPKLLPDYKGLRGDPSDNIIGISGIGEKTASELIQNFGTIEELYKTLKKDKEKFASAGVRPRIVELLEKGEEEAMFSKMLASIRRDAPISFALPHVEWKANFDMSKVEALFKELDFRTLGSRVKAVILNEKKAKKPAGDGEERGEAGVSEEEFKKISVGAWLLDSNFANPSLEDVLNITSTENFEKAKEAVLYEIKRRNLTKVYEEIELPLIPVIERMQNYGIKVDSVFLKKLSEEYHKEIKEREKKIWEMAGVEFNISSPKQLGEILFNKMGLVAPRMKKTAGGAVSTKESELLKLADLHPIISLVLEYREFSKLTNTYIDTLPTLVKEDGRLHTTLYQTGTTTGRLSSADPNLQNIPIKSELGRRIRDAFVAEKGFKLVAFDYSQIELRVAAFLSKDEEMIKIFQEGRDVHTEVAARVFGVPADEVTKEMRGKAKTINFGVMYGMGVTALQQNLKSDRKEAQAFLNQYFETFKGLANYLEKTKGEAKLKGYTETYFGRRRYFEGIQSKIPFIRAMAERMAINAPIQGTEADVIKLAMSKIDSYIEKEGLRDSVRLILQVHDELILEIKDGVVEKVAPKIKEIMENIITPKEIFDIKLLVEYGAGDSWGESK
ncbi:MAG: DNA polymerase [Candidatus Taylorbacteria bacterium]|nr:DNA polymerase [Candidatus Taylorbacteria bacterium]